MGVANGVPAAAVTRMPLVLLQRIDSLFLVLINRLNLKIRQNGLNILN